MQEKLFNPEEMPPPIESGLPPEEILSEKDLAVLKEMVGGKKTALHVFLRLTLVNSRRHMYPNKSN